MNKQTKVILESLSSHDVFYHGTNQTLPIGVQIDFNPKFARGVSLRTENFLEEHRPENKISRRGGFFLAFSPSECSEISGGVDYKHYYKVRPVGQIDIHREIWMLDVDDPFGVYGLQWGVELAKKYGEDSDKAPYATVGRQMKEYQIYAAQMYWSGEDAEPAEDYVEWITKSIIVISEVDEDGEPI